MPGVVVYAALPDNVIQSHGCVRLESEGLTDNEGRFRFSILLVAPLHVDSSKQRDEHQVVDTAKTHELTLQGELKNWYRRELDR
ncbi:MAG: hypothetical protein ACK5Q5_13925 [Planctomycetaceae bacterium]